MHSSSRGTYPIWPIRLALACAVLAITGPLALAMGGIARFLAYALAGLPVVWLLFMPGNTWPARLFAGLFVFGAELVTPLAIVGLWPWWQDLAGHDPVSAATLAFIAAALIILAFFAVDTNVNAIDAWTRNRSAGPPEAKPDGDRRA
jgi:hypothetical protein